MLSSCPRCNGSGLVTHKVAAIVCLVLAAAWCVAALLLAQYVIDQGYKGSYGSRRAVGQYLILAAPPVALTWFGFYSPFFKQACPRCTPE